MRILVILLLGLFLPQFGLSAATLSVMTFNIRNASSLGSLLVPPNGWFDLRDSTNPDGLVNGRRLRAIAVIRANEPDILGVQESVALQTEDLKGELAEYSYFGVGRDDGQDLGEQNGIFYRSDRFDRFDGGHFWLSDTPEVPGTTFATSFDSGNPRMVTWVQLGDRLSGADFFVLNTHWSLTPSARLKSADLIRQRMQTIAGNSPLILMGDLNTSESSTSFGVLRDGNQIDDRLLIDSYRAVHAKTNQEKTFQGFNGGSAGSRIDHILFSSGDFTVIDAAIDRTTYDGLYPSDHYPVTTTLMFTVPEPIGSSLFVFLAVSISSRRRARC